MNIKSGPIIENSKVNFLTSRIANTKNLNTINIFNQQTKELNFQNLTASMPNIANVIN